MDLGLRSKRALVLASTKGLGRTAAEALAAEGADVVITSSDKQRCDLVAADIAARYGTRVIGTAADAFDPQATDRLYARATDAMGGIDILIVNHTGPLLGVAIEIDLDALQQQFLLMVANPIRLIRSALPGMRARKWGRIISISGGSIVQPLPNKVMDNTLRPAMVGYTKALANEVAVDGVTVNIVLPGTFITDRVHDSTASNARLMGITVEEAMKRRIESIPAGRFGELREFGATVAFMAGEPSSYMTGSIIRVDGSQTRSIL
jgi:3-oxoacyl-[acyl-carrier protein] reductase